MLKSTVVNYLHNEVDTAVIVNLLEHFTNDMIVSKKKFKCSLAQVFVVLRIAHSISNHRNNVAKLRKKRFENF